MRQVMMLAKLGSFMAGGSPRHAKEKSLNLNATLTIGMARLLSVLVTASILGVCPVAHAALITLPCVDLFSCPGPPGVNIMPNGFFPGTSHLDLNFFSNENLDVAPLTAFTVGGSFAAFGACFNVSATSEGCTFVDTLNNPANYWHWETRIGNTGTLPVIVGIAIIPPAGPPIVGLLGIAGGSFTYVDVQFADIDGSTPVAWNWLVTGLPPGLGIDTSVREFIGVIEPPPVVIGPFTPAILDPPGDFFTPISDPNFMPDLFITLTQVPEPNSLLLLASGLAALTATAMRRRKERGKWEQ